MNLAGKKGSGKEKDSNFRPSIIGKKAMLTQQQYFVEGERKERGRGPCAFSTHGFSNDPVCGWLRSLSTRELNARAMAEPIVDR